MKTERITPENITTLSPEHIFVFGSNLSGWHGGGAARTAKIYFGAQENVGVGRTGQCYAIPTKSHGITRTLLIEEIKPFVDNFIKYAKAHPELTFLVTEVGCGLAGILPVCIAPLFTEAMTLQNTHLPERFWNVLKEQHL